MSQRRGIHPSSEPSAEHETAANGLRMAQAALHAVADGDEARMLAAINSGTHAETAWAAAYLVVLVRESVTRIFKGDPRKTRKALHAAANNRGDEAGTRVRLTQRSTRKL